MKALHYKGLLRASRVFLACLICTAGQAGASTVILSNATITTYDAISGDVSFDWDLNSIYSITGTDVQVGASQIITGGPSPVGTVYEFIIPNFYDPLPLKTVDITLRGGNANASGFDLPRVLSVTGADSDYNTGGPAVPVPGSFISGTTSSLLVTEYWEMYPNPDFETVTLFVPNEFKLQSITIATQSTVIPVPAAFWLFASGLFAMAGVLRNKRKLPD